MSTATSFATHEPWDKLMRANTAYGMATLALRVGCEGVALRLGRVSARRACTARSYDWAWCGAWCGPHARRTAAPPRPCLRSTPRSACACLLCTRPHWRPRPDRGPAGPAGLGAHGTGPRPARAHWGHGGGAWRRPDSGPCHQRITAAAVQRATHLPDRGGCRGAGRVEVWELQAHRGDRLWAWNGAVWCGVVWCQAGALGY